MPGKIFYWNNIYNKRLIEQHSEILEKLQAGHFKSADLDLKKSVSGEKLYTVRLNDADRLLFTTIQDANGQPAIMLLEEVKNHDYQKSRFLKPAVLSAFLKNKAPAIIAQENFDERSFEVCDPEDLMIEQSDNEGYEYIPMNYHNQSFIQFNDSQQKAFTATLPLLVSGPPGSGKTCILEAAAGKAAEKAELFADDQAVLLIVTSSRFLINNLNELWKQYPEAQIGKVKLELKTYEDLMADNPALAEFKTVDKNHFQTWMVSYINKAKTAVKAKGELKELNMLLDAFKIDKVYQEFRVMSGYSEAQYKNLGKRQSIFIEPKQRNWLWQAYQDYQLALQAKNQIHPAFAFLGVEKKYAFIAVDEAQDFSHLQLKQLFKLAQNEEIMYCIDSNQSIDDDLSKRSFMETLSAKMKSVELPGSYRCPKLVVAFANQVLAIKYMLTGGASDKKEITEIGTQYSQEEGIVDWPQPAESVITQIAEVTRVRSDWAVITDENYVEETKQIFDTELVFTVKDIKGLEYATVVVYRLLESDIFYQANKLLPDENNEIAGNIIHRAKAGESNPEYAPSFNQLFTAMTRTIGRLIFLQNSSHSLAKVISCMQQGLPKTIINKPFVVEAQRASSNVEWLIEAKRLIEKGQEERARKICMKHLHMSKLNYDAFINSIKKNNDNNNSLQASQPSAPENEPKNSLANQASSSNHNAQSKSEKKPKSSIANQASSSNRNAQSKAEKKESRKEQFTENYKAFFTAVQKGNISKVKKFITKIDNINKIDDSSGATALIIASFHGFTNLVKLLLKNGAEVNIPSDKKETALHGAVIQRHKAIVKILLENGADVHACNKKGFTPYHAACLQPDVEILDILFQKGARTETRSSKGNTPLLDASKGGNVDTVQMLLKHGADVNAYNNEGSTALHIAATHGWDEIIKLLLENKNTQINAKDNEGRTPLDNAAKEHYITTIKLLHDSGAKGERNYQFLSINDTEAASETSVGQANIPQALNFMHQVADTTISVEKDLEAKVPAQAKSANPCTFWSAVAVGVGVCGVLVTNYLLGK